MRHENAEAVIAGLNLDNLIQSGATFKREVLAACKALARTKPWQGDTAKRVSDLGACLSALVAGYSLSPIALKHVGSFGGCSGGSTLSPDGRSITLRGRISVVTLLHLFAKARTAQARGDALVLEDHVQAIRWSVNLFKRCFPISFGRCHLVGGLLVNDGRRDD